VKQRPRQRVFSWQIVVILVAVVAAVGGWFWLSRQALEGTSQELAPAGARGSADDYSAILGRWQRPDGGYVLEIRSADPDGTLHAAYFNPQPINVARASAAHREGETLVFVELRDSNYPGATYDLMHVRDDDVLVGYYHQPLVGQTFEVYFVRVP